MTHAGEVATELSHLRVRMPENRRILDEAVDVIRNQEATIAWLRKALNEAVSCQR